MVTQMQTRRRNFGPGAAPEHPHGPMPAMAAQAAASSRWYWPIAFASRRRAASGENKER
jgi:hypothetical protein